jgi:membrane fusion protein (multidrug efflux system)
VATKKNAPLVPQRAVREIQGTYQVFVVTDQNKVESRNVKVGVRVGELWLIEEGVSSGEKVVVAALHRVRSGMVVAPVMATSEQPQEKQGAAGK